MAATKIMILAHNHPDLYPGGAEIMAHALFQELKKNKSFKPYFVAATGRHTSRQKPERVITSYDGAEDEFLLWNEQFDYFLQSQPDRRVLSDDLVKLLLKLQPDIVHFHHTLRIGMEALRVVRDILPLVKIIYTLHDFIPLCHRDGQMVRTFNNTLCDEASPRRCGECFPEQGAARFMLRESFIKSHMALVDGFISPSSFLAQRYVEWGVPAERMTIIPNGHQQALKRKKNARQPRKKPNRFAFFGQVTPYKGVLLLLESARNLQLAGFHDFHLAIHGSAELQMPAFQREFHAALQAAGPCVTFEGPYERAALPALMAKTDWVVTPSIWWENAPLVIDEAFLHGCPVICSNIGGMAEKVRHGENGLHVPVGDAAALARTMQAVAPDTALWERLSKGIAFPRSAGECAQAHAQYYFEQMNARKSQSPISRKDTAKRKRADRR